VYTRYSKTKSRTEKQDKKTQLKEKPCVNYLSRNTSKGGYAIQMTYFICYLSYWKELRQGTAIHTLGFFLRCVAMMADRYRIQEFRNPPLSPTHSSMYNISLYCLTKYPKHDQMAWFRMISILMSIMSWLFLTQATKLSAAKSQEGNTDSRGPTETCASGWAGRILTEVGEKSNTTEECQFVKYCKCYFS